MRPTSAEELAEGLATLASEERSIRLSGGGTKSSYGNSTKPAGETEVSMQKLSRVLQYEPRDLTISVQAGMPYAELSAMLESNRQMIPLDPPFAARATVGGVVATNSSGPRRRLYGTARDLVIGMQFATLDGKLINTGGMVVKNVAGLDMAKLLIGSFGTLAAIASVNFKLTPMPVETRTFVRTFASSQEAFAQRDAVLRGVLQPQAIDLLNPPAAADLGLERWTLLVRGGGSRTVLNRYGTELAGFEAIAGDAEQRIWLDVCEFGSRFLSLHEGARIVRVSSSLKDVRTAMESFPGPAIARAGNGVTYGFIRGGASAWKPPAGCTACVEAGASLDGWTPEGDDFGVMQQVKELMDPNHLLNRGSFYGRF